MTTVELAARAVAEGLTFHPGAEPGVIILRTKGGTAEVFLGVIEDGPGPLHDALGDYRMAARTLRLAGLQRLVLELMMEEALAQVGHLRADERPEWSRRAAGLLPRLAATERVQADARRICDALAAEVTRVASEVGP